MNREKLLFITFWTCVLGPFEYFILGLPLLSVLIIRTFAVASNSIWYTIFFSKVSWVKNFVTSILRMVVMKFLVNVTNFILLCLIVNFLFEIEGVHLTLLGFIKKVTMVTVMAIAVTPLYEKARYFLGFEKNLPEDVNLNSDI